MGEKNADKKLDRFSKIIDIITNLGTITSWVLGLGSAYVLNLQKFPVVVPGINFTLDLGFQFSLVMSGILAYLQFFKNYWGKNEQRLNFSDSFSDFIFWDLPNFKVILAWIPFIFAIYVCMLLASKSVAILIVQVFIGLFVLAYGGYRFYLNKKYRPEIEREKGFESDDELKQLWIDRISKKLNVAGEVNTHDFFDTGYIDNEYNRDEIDWAIKFYFRKFELSQGLTLERLRRHISYLADPEWEYYYRLARNNSIKANHK